MTRRYYQLFALALLIGAPLLVNLLSNFVPGIHPLGPPAAQASVQPEYMQPAANPGANLPSAQPNPPPVAQAAQQTNSDGTAPMFNPTGVSVAGTDPSAAAAAINPAAPAASAEPTGPSVSADFADDSHAPADSEEGMIQRREHAGR